MIIAPTPLNIRLVQKSDDNAAAAARSLRFIRGNPIHADLHRANAATFNAAAGWYASQLGLATLLHQDRQSAIRNRQSAIERAA